MSTFRRVAAAIAFYTCLPVPQVANLPFETVSRYAPIVGLLIGLLLSSVDSGLWAIGMPGLTRSAIVVALWISITGGLHLDGAMDTADGLAVTDPERRLSVMADSRTGAFGAMTAAMIILLKTAALTDLQNPLLRWIVLPLIAGWGRWAQQIAIARYPYLKPTGKGSFHKQAIRSLKETIPCLLLLAGLSLLVGLYFPIGAGVLAIAGVALSLLVPGWFGSKLGGHTGDSYGAVVEWTEVLLLILLTLA
ncbi:adenosylcobinamide-GDP ribazoletransferase [Leptolyngbya ohadii]|uniref:adenosylcobinamide-GDP ribazoletransferase n=1 Tax=Leptolyngbya ohadii TaxID=1962290 RepID=UPI000B5996BC|nr:adenosylcobinamide-GDP ribazoletransferase [Leptolyngbya ohadii]